MGHRTISRPASHRRRRKPAIIGNCQSETLRQDFARIETLNRLFDVKYHFVQLPKNLHEFAARDLETCDIVLIQDIRLWDEFPLRDHVRAGEGTRYLNHGLDVTWLDVTWEAISASISSITAETA